jgi:hypothetical protein
MDPMRPREPTEDATPTREPEGALVSLRESVKQQQEIAMRRVVGPDAVGVSIAHGT